jgi:hypothetical protein
MKWFRSRIRFGSRLALFALAIQFLLSFGHFHGSAQASAADAGRAVLHDAIGVAVAHSYASDRALHGCASGPVRLKTCTGGVPPGHPDDDCAICAVMALANALLDATPPCLSAPQAVTFQYLAADAEFVAPNPHPGAFQPRAPPIA